MPRFDRICWWALLCLGLSQTVSLRLSGADQPPGAGEEAGSADRIARLVEQLGADDFGTRERAQSELAQLGLEAYDALHAAQSHREPEISLRARYLVRSMSVRWFADSDSPKVVTILKEYGDLQEDQRKNRIDRLAMLEDNLGVAPLLRLARFETSDLLARYAALKLLEMPAPDDDAAKARLAASIGSIMGKSKRPAAVWLALYGRTLSDPLGALAEWDKATQEEHAALAKTPERTSREIVRDLYRFQVELLKRLNRDEEAIAVIRRTFALLDGTPPQVQEIVDWLMHREAWPVALEVMQRFDGTVQDSARLLYRLAGTYDKLGEKTKAAATAQKALALRPESLDDHLLIGHELEDLPGLAQWAEAEYRQVLRNATPGSKSDFRARFSLSELLHDRLQELPAAEVLGPVCDLLAKDESAKTTCEMAGRIPEGVVARMHYFYACHDHERQDLEGEKKRLKAAVEAYYKDADVLIAMYRLPQADEAWRALAKEKIDAVADEFLREIEEDRVALEAADSEQTRREATFNLGRNCNQFAWLVGNTYGDYQRAVKLSQEAVKISQQLLDLKPSYPGFLDTLGRAYYSAGDVVNAVKSQSLAAALNPTSGQIRRQLEFFQRAAAERGIDVSGVVAPSVSDQPPGAKPEPAKSP